MGQSGASLLPEGFSGPGRDVAKAKALLKEAGVTPPVTVDFMVPKGAETEAVAQVIQSMAAETGFDMKIRVTEFATSLKQAEAGEYQAYMLAWSGRIDPDGNSYVFLHNEAPQNYSAWTNAEADKALDDARLVTDQANARRSTKSSPRSCSTKSRSSTSITAGS